MANLYEIDEQIMQCIDEDTGEILDMEKLNHLHAAGAEGGIVGPVVQESFVRCGSIKSRKGKLCNEGKISKEPGGIHKSLSFRFLKWGEV